VEENKKILIIIDETPSARIFAGEIVFCIKNSMSETYDVSIIYAENFMGNDLLPAYAFFIGCEKPEAFSLLYIDELFAHINLAGRPCGIFSSNNKAAKYLVNFVKISEAAQGKPFIFKNGTKNKEELLNWVNVILKTRRKNERI